MNIIEVKTYDFKTNLSSYIADLNAGKMDKVIVKNRDKIVGEFLPPSTSKKKYPWGALGKKMSQEERQDFDAMMSDDNPAYQDAIKHILYGKIFPDEPDDPDDPRLNMTWEEIDAYEQSLKDEDGTSD